MPWLDVYHILIHSILIQILSSNEYSHQVFKVDLGQDITMSCRFDQEKIEQVKIPSLDRTTEESDSLIG